MMALIVFTTCKIFKAIKLPKLGSGRTGNAGRGVFGPGLQTEYPGLLGMVNMEGTAWVNSVAATREER